MCVPVHKILCRALEVSDARVVGSRRAPIGTSIGNVAEAAWIFLVEPTRPAGLPQMVWLNYCLGPVVFRLPERRS